MTNHYKRMKTNDVTGVTNMLSATDNEHHAWPGTVVTLTVAKPWLSKSQKTRRLACARSPHSKKNPPERFWQMRYICHVSTRSSFQEPRVTVVKGNGKARHRDNGEKTRRHSNSLWSFFCWTISSSPCALRTPSCTRQRLHNTYVRQRLHHTYVRQRLHHKHTRRRLHHTYTKQRLHHIYIYIYTRDSVYIINTRDSVYTIYTRDTVYTTITQDTKHWHEKILKSLRNSFFWTERVRLQGSK